MASMNLGPSGHLFQQASITVVYTAGDMYTINDEGQTWPVVVCDRQFADIYFKGIVKEAQNVDDTWPDGYKDGQIFEGLRKYPVLKLGDLERIWVIGSQLLPFNTDDGYKIYKDNKVDGDIELADAWVQALIGYLYHVSFAYWEAKVERQLGSSKQENENEKKAELKLFEEIYGHAEEDDDDEEVVDEDDGDEYEEDGGYYDEDGDYAADDGDEGDEDDEDTDDGEGGEIDEHDTMDVEDTGSEIVSRMAMANLDSTEDDVEMEM